MTQTYPSELEVDISDYYESGPCIAIYDPNTWDTPVFVGLDDVEDLVSKLRKKKQEIEMTEWNI